MKFDKKKTIGLFLLSVLIYGAWVCFFTSTVHVDVDEELYVALARSFHYRGNFAAGDELLNYNCVLYSLLLSACYFFYSPKKILLFMRWLGVLLMCSSIFPIQMLSHKILREEKKAFGFGVFMMVMPYMADCAYLMQEVLSFPLFLWTLYFGYTYCEKKAGRKKTVCLILGAVLSALCFFAKTYLFFIPIVLNSLVILKLIREKKLGNTLWRIAVYDVIYLLTAAGIYYWILMVNEFEMGSNHYSAQFSHLFPVSVQTLMAGLAGCILYFLFLLVNMGMIPLETLWMGRKRLTGAQRMLADFCIASLVFLVIEIVFMVVLTEEGIHTLPHKFLFRYFHIFVPPVFLLFFRLKEEVDIRVPRIWVANGIACLILAGYFEMMGKTTRQAIIDGHLFLLLENISKFVIPHLDGMLLMLSGIGSLLTARVLCHNKLPLMKFCVVGFMIVTLGVWGINGIQLPVYNNLIAWGKTIQNDGVQIAEYLNEEDIAFVYYVDDRKIENYYLRNFYGYIKQPYQVIETDDIYAVIEKEDRKIALIMPKENTGQLRLTEVKLQTERLALCLPEA